MCSVLWPVLSIKLLSSPLTLIKFLLQLLISQLLVVVLHGLISISIVLCVFATTPIILIPMATIAIVLIVSITVLVLSATQWESIVSLLSIGISSHSSLTFHLYPVRCLHTECSNELEYGESQDDKEDSLCKLAVMDHGL